MRISPVKSNTINKQNQSESKNYATITILNLKSPNDSIYFGSRESDLNQRVEKELNAKYQSGIKKWWNRDKIEEKVKYEMEQEDKQRDIDNAVYRETIALNQKRLDEMQRHNQEEEEARARLKEAYDEAKIAKDETIVQQGKALEATQQLAKDRQEQSEKFEKLFREQVELVQKHDEENKNLLKRMEEAQNQNDIKTKEALEQQRKNMEEMFKRQFDAYQSGMNKASEAQKMYEEMENLRNAKGFLKIAGYDHEKNLLIDNIGKAVLAEKQSGVNEVPNGILFFGPKGNGKTTFAQALAGQLDCELVNIENTLDDKENLKNLREVAAQAQERFESTKKRTIVMINEFDVFAPKDSPITGALKGFMDDLSKKYHCTLFATTNDPEKIDDILLRDGRFKIKAGLAPANKVNALAVLQHYAEGHVTGNINYNELVEEITKGQPNEAFSNSRIKSLIYTFIEKNENLGKKMTHLDIQNAIKEIGPDIAKEAMEIFRKQLEYVKHI